MKQKLLTILLLLNTAAAVAAPSKIIRHRDRGVPDEWIVVLRHDMPNDAVHGLANSLAASYSLKIEEVWQYSLHGFLCSGSEANVRAMSEDPRVEYVEQDFTSDTPRPNVSSTQLTTYYYNGTWEYMWHLDRVDEPFWSQHDSTNNMCTEGRSVYAYVIDTGVDSSHPQFEGRVELALDFSGDSDPNQPYAPDATRGCSVAPWAVPERFHGTAVASVLGGTQVGIAKPTIVSLKVARCSTGEIRTSSLISAAHWISNPWANPYFGQPGVINHSGFVPLWKDDSNPVGDDRSAYSA